MNRHTTRFAPVLGLLAALAAPASQAHEGEDHGPPPALAAQRHLLPRVTAHSDLFELVGVLEPGRLLIWLDASPTNAPVARASIEVEGLDGGAARASEIAPGVYAVALAKAPAAGTHPLTFTVQAGDDTDLLGGTLQGAAAAGGADADHEDTHAAPSWRTKAAWAATGAGAGALLVAGLGALRRRQES